jgi:hypothetical protein
MILVRAFLMSTSTAYLACCLYSTLGKPALSGVNKTLQEFFYLLMVVLIGFVAFMPSIQILNLVLGVVYAFASVGSFIGWPQVWMAYWKEYPEEGSDAGQIGMALWDLALSISFFLIALA